MNDEKADKAIEELKKKRPREPRKNQLKSERVAGRNDPCPCGSGKKYKKCCGKKSN